MPKLGELIRDLLCEVASGGIDACKCENPAPTTYYCAYGTCVIYRCRNCGRVISASKGECSFPYSR